MNHQRALSRRVLDDQSEADYRVPPSSSTGSDSQTEANEAELGYPGCRPRERSMESSGRDGSADDDNGDKIDDEQADGHERDKAGERKTGVKRTHTER
jgi:hypothetical protein